MVLTAASSALRRSELRGLKWADLDLENLWFHLRRGLVRKDETNMKTRASRKGIPMLPELAVVLREWRRETHYAQESDWVFASPFTSGRRPYWAESALRNHIEPAVIKAGVTKHLSWHVFRHSFASMLRQAGHDVSGQFPLRGGVSRYSPCEARFSSLHCFWGMIMTSLPWPTLSTPPLQRP